MTLAEYANLTAYKKWHYSERKLKEQKYGMKCIQLDSHFKLSTCYCETCIHDNILSLLILLAIVDKLHVQVTLFMVLSICATKQINFSLILLAHLWSTIITHSCTLNNHTYLDKVNELQKHQPKFTLYCTQNKYL